MPRKPYDDRYREIAHKNLILLTEVGSGLHGVNISGTDDHDEMGVCIEPPETILGLEDFEHYVDRWHADGTRIPDGERSGFGDTDHTIYSLRKYIKLCAQGNPTVLMPLFAPENKVLYQDPADLRRHTVSFGRLLRGSRVKFLSKQAGYRFLGYSNSQRQQMVGEVGRKHTNRPELVDKYGFDTKFAYHALRLTWQGEELMRTGDITLPMSAGDRHELLQIRKGHVPLDFVVEKLDESIAALLKAIRDTELPEKPDFDYINHWLSDMHLYWWRQNGLWKPVEDIALEAVYNRIAA